MFGPAVFVRTLSVAAQPDKDGNVWQYNSRSDYHSKVACALAMFDLLSICPRLAEHVRTGRVGFGVNHEMRDFRNDRKKNLDLVLCTPATGRPAVGPTLASMADTWSVAFDDDERRKLAELPAISRVPVGSVLVALEAKACMTEHQKALPRLYDELNSSHLTIHGSSADAIAVGLVCVNAAERFLSSGRNAKTTLQTRIWTEHRQPKAASITIDKVRRLPRRTRPAEEGYDALGIVVVDLANDGSPVRLVNGTPAPAVGDIDHYASMIDRIASSYANRFAAI